MHTKQKTANLQFFPSNNAAIHKLELERLRILFEREAQDLKWRQESVAEGIPTRAAEINEVHHQRIGDKYIAEMRISELRQANSKTSKQLKEAQALKLAMLRDSQMQRRFRKQQRSMAKAQKYRQLSELREKQIEEIEELRKRHRQELFNFSNETRREARKQKYELV